MFPLLDNVHSNGLDRSWANGKGTVSLLPFKFSSKFFVNPFRRISLQIAKKVVQSMFRFETDKCMSMILDAANLQRHRVETFYDPAHVRVQPGFPFRIDQSTSVLG